MYSLAGLTFSPQLHSLTSLLIETCQTRLNKLHCGRTYGRFLRSRRIRPRSLARRRSASASGCTDRCGTQSPHPHMSSELKQNQNNLK